MYATLKLHRVRLPRLLISLVIFEAAWFACVAGAAHDQVGWGIAAVAAAIAAQLTFSKARAADLKLIAAALLCGLVWDSALLNSHVVAYASPGPVHLLAPAWILALWAQFGSVLRELLRWLHTRPRLATALGAVGGAASYAAAQRLGACTLPAPGIALPILAAGWGLLVPLLLWLARRVEADKS